MRRLGIAMTGLALALTTGCSGAGPKPSPFTPSAAPATPIQSAPVLPEAAKANTVEGAKAFLLYYVGLFNRASETGDTTALQSLEDPRCESCRRVRSSIHDVFDQGGSATGGQMKVSSTQVAIRGRAADLRSTISITPQLLTRASGKVERSTGARFRAEFALSWTGSAWAVREWTRLS